MEIDRIESAAWMLLDVADYLRQRPHARPGDRPAHTALRVKIMRQLRQQEKAGDPLGIVAQAEQLLKGAEKQTA